MKLNAVGVTSSNFNKTIRFYNIIGFEFEPWDGESDHIESIDSDGSATLMIDNVKLMKGLIGELPKPTNHSAFAVEYDESKEVDKIVAKVKQSGFKVVKEPWDAFWGERYAVVEDPDGYRVDLYAYL